MQGGKNSKDKLEHRNEQSDRDFERFSRYVLHELNKQVQ